MQGVLLAEKAALKQSYSHRLQVIGSCHEPLEPWSALQRFGLPRVKPEWQGPALSSQRNVGGKVDRLNAGNLPNPFDQLLIRKSGARSRLCQGSRGHRMRDADFEGDDILCSEAGINAP